MKKLSNHSSISKRTKRRLLKKEPKINENTKNALILKGLKTSEFINKVLKELAMLKNPDIKTLSQRQDIKIFEDPTSIEFLSKKHDCSLFLFGNHSKKRPNNLIIGRLFDYHILDIIECGLENFQSMETFKKIEKSAIGNKPCFLFVGEEFENKEEFKKWKNLFIDFFRGSIVNFINLAGLEHVIVCFSSPENKIYIRIYRIFLKKSGTKIPKVELKEMGPFLDLIIRRYQFASEDLLKEATKEPTQHKIKKIKNISKDTFAKTGTIHIPKQDLSQLATRKMKGFEKNKKITI